MTPNDHWNAIKLANPRYRSPNMNGWDLRPYESKKGPLRGIVLTVFAGALIVAGLIAWRL